MRVKVTIVRDKRFKSVQVASPKDAFELLKRQARGLDREHLWRVDLDARNAVLGVETVSIGTLTASLVHPREFFKAALVNSAASVLMCHNHPSQELKPSPEDRETTRRIQSAGKLLGVPLVDSLIICDAGFYSFREAGML